MSTKLSGAGTGVVVSHPSCRGSLGFPPFSTAPERAEHGRMAMLSALSLRNNPQTRAWPPGCRGIKVKSLGHPVQAPEGGHSGAEERAFL